MIIEEIVGMINTLHKGGVNLLSQDLGEPIIGERSDHLFDNSRDQTVKNSRIFNFVAILYSIL